MDIRTKCIEFSRKKVKESIGIDNFVVQLVSHIEDLDKVFNILIKRLRDWYSLYLPEIVHLIQDNEAFLREIRKDKKELMQKYDIKTSMV